MTNKIEKTRLLVVEGRDEVFFFDALLEHQSINNVQVMDVGGKDKFKTYFQPLSMAPDFDKVECLGFIRDAEQNEASSAFNSICSILKENKIPYPSHQKIITTGEKPRTGIFIMLDNESPGMLEEL